MVPMKIEAKLVPPDRRRAAIEAFRTILEARPDAEAMSGEPISPAPEAAVADAAPRDLTPVSRPVSDNLVDERAILEKRAAALIRNARDLAEDARSPHTLRIYDGTMRNFATFRRRTGIGEGEDGICPEHVGLWITWLSDQNVRVTTIKLRLNALLSVMRMRQTPIDRGHPAIREVMAGLTRRRTAHSQGKAALRPEEVVAMADACERGTKRGLRDRAILLLGFASGLRRSEIVRLDCARFRESEGWIELERGGLLLHVRGKTGWRQVAVARGETRSCPVKAVEDWMEFGRIAHGPLFRTMRRGDSVAATRLTDKSVYDLVREMAAKVGLDARAFGAHSLRAGHATFSQASEADVQQQLGHKSVGMTRRYRRQRDPFANNLTKAVGL